MRDEQRDGENGARNGEAEEVELALERLELVDEPVEVLLGGGLLQSGDGPLTAAIEAGLGQVGPSILVKTASSPPIVGSVLLGLDALGAGSEARARAQRELAEALDDVERRKGLSDG